MSIIEDIRGLVGLSRKPSTRPPAGPPLTSQKQANAKPFDGPAGSPYKVKHLSRFGSKLPTTPPITGKKAVKLPGARVFNMTNTPAPYLIPKGRAAAGYAGASNGGQFGAPGTYLDGRKIKQRIDLKLDTLTTDLSINMAGSVVVYADSTLGTDRLNVRFATSDGDQSAPLVPFRPGQFIGGERYSKLLVSWAAQAGSTATLLIVEDKPGDEFTYR